MAENVDPGHEPGNKPRLTISRMHEISKADAAGTPLDLSPEERAEYEAGNASIRKIMKDLAPTISASMPKFKNLDMGSLIPNFDVSAISALNRGPSNKLLAGMEATQRRNQEMMDDFARTAAENHKSKAEAAAAEADAQRIRDEQMALQTAALSTLASQSLGQSKFNWWVLVIGLLTLLATVAGTVVGIIALAKPGG